MTAQIAERLIYQGREVSMCTEPLSDYFAFGGNKPEFQFTCTALWRGYVGSWEIINDRLYLIELHGVLTNGEEATLETVFPGYAKRVFAHWYSGDLRVPEGKMLEYVHMGYASTYERDVILSIDRGVVVGRHVQDNGTAIDDEGPEGYGIAAMTVFPLANKDQEGKQ